MTRTLNLAERRIGWHRMMRSRWAAHVAELGVILAAAAATTFLARALIAARFEATSPQAKALGPLWAAAMIALAIAGYLVRRLELSPARERLAVSSLAGVAVGLVMTPLMAGLHGTAQPLNTILGGDQQFHTEYVTRFASTWHLQDYTFRDLHAFYPPAWFWLAGRTADLLGVTPVWHVIKPFTIGTIGAALLFSYVLWSMVLSRAGALSAAIGSSLVLTSQTGPLEFATQSWYSPHSCFVAVVGVAWLAATLCAVRRDRADAGRLVLLALVGALLALSYYLLFLLLLAVLAVLIVATRAGRRPAIRRFAVLCGGMAVLTAVFWAPALATALRGNPSQGHFVRPDFLHVSVGFDGPTALALLAGVAVVLLALTFTRPASQAVGALLVGTVVYQFASLTTLLIAQNQLQPHRAVTMMWATFGAAVPVAIEGMRRPDTLVGALPPAVVRVLQVATLSLAIPAIFLLGSDLGSDLAAGPYTKAAHHPPGLAPAKEVTSFITQTTGKGPQDLTLLTDYRAPLVTEPYYGFLPLRARYANPDAKLTERVAVLRSAAACPDAACTTRELTQSKFGPIDAMVLTLVPGGYRVDTQIDAYPHPKNVSVTFPRRNIDPAVWSRRNVAHYAVFARRPG